MVELRKPLIIVGGFTLLLLVVQFIALFLFGQPLLCDCGYVKIWEGVVLSSGTSQHISDWYTFSHIIHGFLFYLLLWFLFPRMPVLWRLFIATGIEVSWEVIENTPWVINAYREQVLAQGYVGDSILNSIIDTLAMALGFLLARKWPVWFTIAIGLGMELFVGMSIRDNLTLNILNFIYQFEFIDTWQRGG